MDDRVLLTRSHVRCADVSGRPCMIITLSAAVTGALVGLLLWSRLRTLAYRRPYDNANKLGGRSTHRWVLLLVPVAWAWLTFTSRRALGGRCCCGCQ